MGRAADVVRLARRLILLGAVAGILPTSAGAQRSASIVAGANLRRDTLPAGGARSYSSAAKRIDQGGAVGMANGALIGAGIGAAIGLVTAPIINAQNSDHSEDALNYVVLPAFGAFLGLIVGGIVGWTRGP